MYTNKLARGSQKTTGKALGPPEMDAGTGIVLIALAFCLLVLISYRVI
jgi:hypothetical protein